MKRRKNKGDPQQMSSIRQHLLLYDDLADTGRADTDAYLERHPEAWRVITEGRRLRYLIRKGSVIAHDEDIPLLLTLPSIGAEDLPAELSKLRERLLSESEDDAAVLTRYRRLQERLDIIDRELPNASIQFASLRDEELIRHDRSRYRRIFSAKPHIRDAFRKLRVSGSGRRVSSQVLLVVSIVVMLIGSAWLVSEATIPTHQRMAALSKSPESFHSLRLRDSAAESDPVGDLFMSALNQIEESRSWTFGLFPRYDEAGLESAAESFRTLMDLEPAQSALSLEARFMLARVHLHRGELAQAKNQLYQVIELGGPSAAGAQRLLREID